ncbi:MAG: DUF4388 domain-containing protein [Anaerolineae bacterium]
MSIEGDLRDISLASLIQLNCSEGNTARLRLRHEGRTGVVFFHKGEIVHASYGDLLGERAIYKLLRASEGPFRVEHDATTSERTVRQPGTAILMEGMRRIDEGGRQPGSQLDASAQTLRAIPGATGAVLISSDGVVLAEATEGEAEKEGAVAAFVGNAAQQIGSALGLSRFDWGVVTSTKDRVLTLQGAEYYAGITLSDRASPAMVATEGKRDLSSR